MDITTTNLLRLLQLSSVSLPVGGYAFSQGLELAVEKGWVKNFRDASEWLELQMFDALARVDLPLLARVYDSADAGDEAMLQHWNATALACRETRELRLTDTAMGEALARLLPNVGVPLPKLKTADSNDISFVVLFGWTAHYWQVPLNSALTGYVWSWLENQVAAATKLVPLGQTQAQQLISALQQHVPTCIEQAQALQDEELGASLPALAIASSLHEVQYTRLFRS